MKPVTHISETNIKVESIDVPDEYPNIQMCEIDDTFMLKVENENYDGNVFASDDSVIYERIPWKTESDVVRQSTGRLFEYDENLVLKSEIDIEDSKLESQSSYIEQPEKKFHLEKTKSEKSKAKKSKQNNSKRNQCKFCMKSFISQKSLDFHSRQHPNELPYECKKCATRFGSTLQMERHQENCTQRRFECYVCRLSSLHWRWNRLSDHFRKHTGDKPFKCNCCSQEFARKRLLALHMKYHPKEILRKCSFCKREFPTSEEAKDHESECSLKRQMECYLCKSLFTYKSSLLRHMPQHTGSNKFKCKYCVKAYARKDFFIVHMKTHIQELPFNCERCKQRFLRKVDLDGHTLICTKQLFECDLCNYSTMSKTYAQDHKQKHIGNDEFKCWHCPSVFLQRSKLVYHVKTHNKKIPFHCPICRKPYQRWLLMENHRQICQMK